MVYQDLFDAIRNCKGAERCWGATNPPLLHPVVVPCLGKPDIMLVTEQRPASKDKSLIMELIEQKQTNSRKGIIPTLEKFFKSMGGFLNDLDEDQGGFQRIYWTHFLKCPGVIRKKKATADLQACANKWLIEELTRLKPRIVVTMGANASKWFLQQANYKKDWRERIWEEFEAIIQEKPLPTLSFDSKQILLIVAPHPSGVNPLKWFNEKLAILLSRNI